MEHSGQQEGQKGITPEERCRHEQRDEFGFCQIQWRYQRSRPTHAERDCFRAAAAFGQRQSFSISRRQLRQHKDHPHIQAGQRAEVQHIPRHSPRTDSECSAIVRLRGAAMCKIIGIPPRFARHGGCLSFLRVSLQAQRSPGLLLFFLQLLHFVGRHAGIEQG